LTVYFHFVIVKRIEGERGRGTKAQRDRGAKAQRGRGAEKKENIQGSYCVAEINGPGY